MKTLKEFKELNEALNAERVAKQTSFKDTEEADDFSSLIQDMLKSKAMLDWAKESGQGAVRALNKSISAFELYLEYLDESN